MIDNFCIQLKSPILDHELAQQVVKNLAYMGKLLKTHSYKETADGTGLSLALGHDMNVEWLIKKVLKEAKYELVYKPKETLKVRPNHYYRYIFIVNFLFCNPFLEDIHI